MDEQTQLQIALSISKEEAKKVKVQAAGNTSFVFCCFLHWHRLRWTRHHHFLPLKRSEADKRAAISYWRAHLQLESVKSDEEQEPWWIDLACKGSWQSLCRIQISNMMFCPNFKMNYIDMLHPHFKEICVLSISIFALELNSHPCPELLACTVLTHSSVYPLNNRTISPVTNQSSLHPFVSLTSRSLLLVQYCETPTGLWRLGFTGRTSRTELSVKTSKHRCHFVDHHRLSSR